jgi:hypothetical protein
MKISSEPKSHDNPARQKAQGCMATNLALPGLGSLAGGKKIGVLQLALCLASFAITLGFGARFIFWSLANWSEYHGANADMDPFKPLLDLWRQARWPLLGIALFGISWFWALLTSRALLAESKNEKAAG